MNVTETGPEESSPVAPAPAAPTVQVATAVTATPDISISPVDALQFDLGARPKMAVVQLRLQHPGPGTAAPAAYKIKTTAPKRYLVRPNQGLLAPGGAQTVDIILVERDHIALRDDSAKGAEAEEKDKFLVQTTAVQSDLLQGWADKPPEEKSEKIISLWSSVDKKAITGRRLKVRFTRPAVNDTTLGAEKSGKDAPARATSSTSQWEANKQNVKAQVAAGATPPTISSMDNPEAIYTEVTNLRKKYDDLVAFTVNLTAERDMLNNELGETKRDLQREVVMRLSLENKAGEGLRQRKKTPGDEKGQDTSSKKENSSKGFSLFQVLLVALICFFIGRYVGMK